MVGRSVERLLDNALGASSHVRNFIHSVYVLLINEVRQRPARCENGKRKGGASHHNERLGVVAFFELTARSLTSQRS